jgi:hypothetical protein
MGFYEDDDSTVDEIREEESFKPITFNTEADLVEFLKQNVECQVNKNYDYYGGYSLHFEVTYKEHQIFHKSDYGAGRTCWDR